MERNCLSTFSVVVLSLSLSGCDVSPDAAKFFNEKIGPLLGVKLAVTAPPPAPKPVAKPTEEARPAFDGRAVNADFIREMTRVVLLRELRSREEFDRQMNALDQGGHYEALYNGVVYAAEYREKMKGVAPVAALKAYVEIMTQIRLDQKFDPLRIQAPEGDAAAAASGEVGPPQPTDAERTAIKDELERDAITKSTYWMKQQLGEELLKTVDLKKEYREKLATWYGHFTVMMNKRGVDFGLPERNKTDEYFHYKWALDADEDRLKWECLNRIHRVINAGAGLHEPSGAPTPPPAASTAGASGAGAPVSH